jgi:breast cancer 2 susceptibility protein
LDCQLDSANEGEEVLEAQQSSRLIIAGNSTAPARWDALLGIQPNPFIAGLSSLSVDGGVIAMMDIVIDKIYPLAFIPQDRALGGDPWDEKEEAIRADKWQVCTQDGLLDEADPT